MAADPFTAVAFKERTTYPCAELSFEAIAEGELPQESVNIVDGSLHPLASLLPDQIDHEDDEKEESQTKLDQPVVEMVVCSFALHLIENPSALFALLWQLSTKARWLVILAPHKKPEIKNGWGWIKWDVDSWAEIETTESKGEILHERVHCRVYRSVNFL
ncbi:hypothetical protein CVT26_009390 [Gymnopilus dilepis]|uniref:Methyltransferase type 11 domain-containing protein n=1 Tax=Gymnopilus dilepis TaxID=231916 RepID=A0A409VK26_9AGAR|nr:hypothetical protein CVT26_009390 [Gymnopilus dilepis]